MAAKEARSGRQTRQWILETSLELFNTHGSAAVSTKKIAAEMGISPGNLYYHFKNKEEIIREMLMEKFNQFTLDISDSRLGPLQKFLNTMQTILAAWQDHAFFKRELVTLLENDFRLKQCYLENPKIVFQRAQLMFEELKSAGLLHVPHEKTVTDLLTLSIVVIDSWPNFLQINDRKLDRKNLQAGVELIIQIWRPYFSPKGLEHLDRLRRIESPERDG